MTASTPIPYDAGGSGPVTVDFDVAFTTSEQFDSGAFFDSLTISLESPVGGEVWFLLTADASGVVWSPPTPGGISASASLITRTAIPFPSLTPAFALQTAFHVSAQLPPELAGRRLTAEIELFDNQDPIPSAGWFLPSPVPEPSTASLLLVLSCALGGLVRRDRR